MGSKSNRYYSHPHVPSRSNREMQQRRSEFGTAAQARQKKNEARLVIRDLMRKDLLSFWICDPCVLTGAYWDVGTQIVHCPRCSKAMIRDNS